MKKRSQRGAARISAVWMIVVVVLFFVSLGFIYVSNQGAAQARQTASDARNAERVATDKYTAELQRTRVVSLVLGYFDREKVGSTSDVDAAKSELTGFKAGLGLDDSVTDFERAVQPILNGFRAKDAEIQTLKGRIASLEGQVASGRQANSRISSDLQGQLDAVNQRLGDSEQTAADDKARLESDVASARSQINQVSSELNDQKRDYDDLLSKSERDAAAATTRQRLLNVQLRIMKEAPGADGEILQVSETLDIGWINRGAKDRVSRGMRFEVRTGKPNPTRRQTKGWAEVIRVQESRSEVRFFDLADPRDPIVSRDKIYNPIFDPGGERYAALIGRFSGNYNESELRLLLEEIGITVQDKLDLTTNYLIVGSPLFHDEEGEPVDDPIQPSELPMYKDAQAKGVFIVSINDLRQYFRR